MNKNLESKKREVDIYNYLLKGLSVPDIADKLDLSIATVNKFLERANSSNNNSIIELCADNLLKWLMSTYKMRIKELWDMYNNQTLMADKIICLRMIKEEDALLLNIVEKFDITGKKETQIDSFMKNLADAMNALSSYQRERVREIILRAINDGIKLQNLTDDTKNLENK